MTATENIFGDLPVAAADEAVAALLSRPGLRIERIVSTGQASPPGFWYDQDWDEWVMVLSGAALLRIESEPEVRRLAAGDYLLIPAQCRHRVEWTDPAAATIWLAIHVAPDHCDG
ncbi:cupin domain-containing protein [Magnetospirillum fulvum]|uniref:Cupin 2 domain-containing protein n=1 Tax=Magnetospirillum fulvum TaxID=1082 RepID=A0A1H6JLX5_MAGFU|nr:cupin domain-containing protein [Magnetospirillum fulvum]SEH63351.1 cupin 2 domain-containing protein [Magnetospirillum fulvum]